VSIASLDNVERDDLAHMPIRYAVGKHNRFDQEPADTQFL
jgi:hypothetical protein